MNFVKFLLSKYFFRFLFFNISWTVARTPIKNTIFWKSMMRSFRWIEINGFNRFRFLAEASTNVQKMHYFGQFKDQNSGRKKGVRQMSPFFSSTFRALTVCDIHFCIWKLSKFIFVGPPWIHSGLQTTWVLEVHAVRLEFGPVRLTAWLILTTFEQIHRSLSCDLKDERKSGELKATISNLANVYWSSYKPTQNTLRKHGILKKLRTRKDIVIVRPDKRSCNLG